MSEVFTVKGKVSLDAGEFHDSVDQAVREGQGLADSIGQISGNVQSFMQSAFSFSVGDLISDGVQAGLQYLKEFATESISIASDLQEVQNVVDVTFGEASASLERWADSAKSQFGLTELQAKQYASTMGAMLKSMGLAENEVYSMSTAMAGLAADMASFYNLDFDEAFSKIRSGISGETEPLKQLGINLSVANLEAYALSQGITTAYEKMTQAEQATLRYNYLLQATADAQGDFARTSDSYANSLRTFETNVTSLKAALGEMLLPAVNGVLDTINDLLSSEQTLGETFSAVEAAFEENAFSIEMNQAKADALINTLDVLSKKENLTAVEAAQWDEAVRQLTAIYPSLNGMIGSATGELNASIESISAETAALKENARAKAKTAAMQEKLDAFADIEFKLGVAKTEYEASKGQLEFVRNRMEEINAEMAEIDELARNASNDSNTSWFGALFPGMSDELAELSERKDELLSEYSELLSEEKALAEETQALSVTYNDLQAQCDAAEAEVDTLSETLAEVGDNTSDAGNGMGDFSNNTEDLTSNTLELSSSLEGLLKEGEEVQAMFDDLEEYRLNNFESIAKSVEGLYDTFENADRVRSTSYKKMSQGVNSQIEQSDRWLAAWNTLKEMGAGDNLMSQFDYSTESIAQMEALIKSGSEGVTAMSEQLETVADKQAEITSAISDTALAVDTEYQNMMTTAETAAADLAEKMTGIQENASGMLASVTDSTGSAGTAVEELQNAGDALGLSEWEPTINAEDNATSIIETIENALDMLDGKTVTTYISAVQNGDVDGSHATGLYRVPFDGYVARLHEDEAVLDKSEANEWRMGKKAGNSGQVVNVTQNIQAVPMTPSELAAQTKYALGLMRFSV